jgi:hypothetical protein
LRKLRQFISVIFGMNKEMAERASEASAFGSDAAAHISTGEARAAGSTVRKTFNFYHERVIC